MRILLDRRRPESGLSRLAALQPLGLDRPSRFLWWQPTRTALEALYRGDSKEDRDALTSPVTGIPGVREEDAKILASIGVRTLRDLAELAEEVSREVGAKGAGDGFHERPSAPAELLPTMLGSVSSTVRYATFVAELGLEGLEYRVNPCAGAAPLPMTGKYSLAEIFRADACRELRLGFLIDHRQRFTNLGTHLGEVSHSLSLAPGESRRIAMVNWHRSQATALTEDVTAAERLEASFVQNRALQEAAGAVALEHQAGATRTEANTAATAGAFVAAGGLVGGIAGGGIGALVGAVAGGTVSVGSLAVPTALVTGAVGAAAGGAAGMAAGGLVWSGANALGMIESSSQGDRDVAGTVNQRIALSTGQQAALTRSLWGTSVLEDRQAEQSTAETRVVANYNHMHALNIEYFEVLQHYLAQVEVEAAEPLLFLPFTALPFDRELSFVRDYWDILRDHVEESLRRQGDLFLATESQPSAPDLQPVPPVPVPPAEAANCAVVGLELELILLADWDLNDVSVTCEVGRANGSVLPINSATFFDGLNTGEKGFRFTYPPHIDNAAAVDSVRVSATWLGQKNITYRIRVRAGSLTSGATTLAALAGSTVAANRTFKPEDKGQVRNVGWYPAVSVTQAAVDALNAYHSAVNARDAVIAENAAATLAFENLVADEARFLQKIYRLFQRRRHYFTRVILSGLEPEELVELLSAVELAVGAESLPLRVLAYTTPVGMTTGALVLRMKPQRRNTLRAVHLQQLAGWPEQVQRRYGSAEARAPHTRSEHIYLPTGGLFAEAILGRANGAEYLDLERYFDWQSSPIPLHAGEIAGVSAESRYQQPPTLDVSAPDGSVNLINPVAFPDPSGLRDALAAVQNGSMFRDMSKSAELTSILGSLAKLASDMGANASKMTGEAGQQALQQAGEIGNSVAAMAQQMMSDALGQAGGAFASMTKQGAILNQAHKQFPPGPVQDAAVDRILQTGTKPVAPAQPSPPSPGGPQPHTAPAPQLQPAPGGAPNAPGAGGPFTTTLPATPKPGATLDVQEQVSGAEQAAKAKLTGMLEAGPNGLPIADAGQFAEVLQEWYRTGVKPGLVQAASDDRHLNSALRQWLDWQAQIQVHGVTAADHAELSSSLEEGRLLARLGIRNAVLEANQRAAATNNWNYLTDALVWGAYAEMFGLDDSIERLSMSEVLADFDLRLVLFDVQVPPALAVNEAAMLQISAGLQIADNPPIKGEPLLWRVTVEGGEAAVPTSGVVNSAGGFAVSVLRTDTDFAITVEVVFKYYDDRTVRSLTTTFEPGLP